MGSDYQKELLRHVDDIAPLLQLQTLLGEEWDFEAVEADRPLNEAEFARILGKIRKHCDTIEPSRETARLLTMVDRLGPVLALRELQAGVDDDGPFETSLDRDTKMSEAETATKQPKDKAAPLTQADKKLQLAKKDNQMLEVSRYDRVTSFMMAMIITMTFLTITLGSIWACNQTWFVASRKPTEVEVFEYIEDVEGGGAEDGELDSSLEAPGPESLTQEPSEAFSPDDVVADFPEMEQTITSVLSAVTSAVTVSDQLVSANPGQSTLPVGSRGTGNKRNIGKGPGDGGGVKRPDRWEIRFGNEQTVAEYAKQLDFFKVELGGVVGGKLYLAKNLSRRTPEVQIKNSGREEKRLFFSWRGGGRRQTDLELLDKAKIPTGGATAVLQFYPEDTEQLLARIELKHAKDNGVDDMRLVRKTRFRVVEKGAGYDFEIINQEYFRLPGTT